MAGFNVGILNPTHPPRFVLGQSIRQRPPATSTQNSRFGGVPRTLWYSAQYAHRSHVCAMNQGIQNAESRVCAVADVGAGVGWYRTSIPLPRPLEMSEGHRDAPGTGCALGALLGDMSRASRSAKAVYTARFKRTLAYSTGLVPPHGTSDRRARAILN